jgi:hypothetical protein
MTCPTGDFVLFDRDEIQLFIEMHFTQRSLLDHSMIQLAFDFHHEQKHVIIRFPRKEDFAGIQLVECTAD